MPELITICLTEQQEQQLEHLRDTDNRPYMRERAAALLKIAAGISPRQVALKGLLKPRKPDTVYDWVKRYQTEGISGRPIKPGRGRKPAYFPKYQDKQEAKAAILHTVRREPSMFGGCRTHWSLDLIGRVCDWLRVKNVLLLLTETFRMGVKSNKKNPSGLSQLLKRLEISYKRGRSYVLSLVLLNAPMNRSIGEANGQTYVHSPDPHYQQKMDLIAQCLLRAWYAPQKYALLYQDEFTLFVRFNTHAESYVETDKTLSTVNPLSIGITKRKVSFSL